MTITTKQKILTAAQTLLYQEGYEAMSPGKVLKLSGAGQGSLYHHFSGKQELARAVLDGVADDFIAMTKAIFDNEHLAPDVKIEQFLGRKRHGLLGCKLGRLANEKAFRDKTMRAPLERYFSFVLNELKQTLKEGIEHGVFRTKMPIEAIAHLIIAAVQGGYVVSKSLNDDDAVNKATQGAIELLASYKTKATTR